VTKRYDIYNRFTSLVYEATDDDDEYIYVFKTPNIRRTQQRDRDADCYL